MPNWELPADLPPGRFVTPEPRAGGAPSTEVCLWVSDNPVPDAGELWARLYAEHPRTGLYPLLLDVLQRGSDRPWHCGELAPRPISAIDTTDPETFLHRSWAHHHASEPWPGLAPAFIRDQDPDATACTLAKKLDKRYKTANFFLGLVPALRGADALTVCGWQGPANHMSDICEISAVVRSWEDRFGARVVGADFNTLRLSFAAPPTTREQGFAIAAEFRAFCPSTFVYDTLIDEVVDGYWMDDDSRAGGILGETGISFWWD
ncbi:DUF4253 domain-containing protein [Actinomadura viridis]|uniref:DUF4253 domain-containing protein n=1 Tax=Actinomadura viridis TaxID=58110 RepID=UPI00367F9AFD